MTDYPLELPRPPLPRDASFSLTNAVARFTSPTTLKPTVQIHPGQRWEVEFQMPIMKPQQAGRWEAFVESLFSVRSGFTGPQGTFLFSHPLRQSPLGQGGGSPVVDGARQAGVNGMSIRGASGNTSGWLLRGDFFQLRTGVDTRLYRIIEDVNTNSAGEAFLRFVPALRFDMSDGESLILNEPKGIFLMTNNSATSDLTIGDLITIQQVNAIEFI